MLGSFSGCARTHLAAGSPGRFALPAIPRGGDPYQGRDVQLDLLVALLPKAPLEDVHEAGDERLVDLREERPRLDVRDGGSSQGPVTGDDVRRSDLARLQGHLDLDFALQPRDARSVRVEGKARMQDLQVAP